MEPDQASHQKRGVGLRIFGIVLLLLSALNIMMSMKAGAQIDSFYYVMIIAGIVVLFLGYIRGKEKT